MSKRVLGRGLSALLPDNSEEPEQNSTSAGSHSVSDVTEDSTTVSHDWLMESSDGGDSVKSESDNISYVIQVPLSQVRANPFQPRRKFDEERLTELAESIKVHGILQPVVVTKAAEGYRLVVGERRTRAARAAGLETIPAIVREMADQQSLEVALIENLQREDLNPIEEAQAFSYLIHEHGLTHEVLAQRLGCSRPAVSNALRLLQLSDSIREDLENGNLSAGHARAVMAITNERERADAWAKIRDRGMSVRESESFVQGLLAGPMSEVFAVGTAKKGSLSPDWQELIDQLRVHLNADVHIVPKANGKGKVEFRYSNREELDALLELFVEIGEHRGGRRRQVFVD